jgi:ABC-type transport system involved in multi-copper enzyme maturation permease subunit
MVPLYLCAVIQITFGFWARQPSIALVMANFCLILKCFLFLVIAWLLETRHLIFYLERLHKIQAQLENWRNEFRVRKNIRIAAANQGGA